jgi:acyl carrier protein
MSEELLLRVRTVVAATLNLPLAQVNGGTCHGHPPEWDSLAQLNIILSLEQEFDVSLAPEQVELMTSVDAIVRQLRH